MSSVSVNQPAGRDTHRGAFEKGVMWMLRAVLPPARDNQEAADFRCESVGTSSLFVQWAAVRPDTLLEGHVSEYTLHENLVSSLFRPDSITMANVAHFICELVSSDVAWARWSGKLPVIINATTCLPTSPITWRGYARPEVRDASRIDSAERRGTATKVQEITNRLNTDYDKHSSPQPTATIPGKPDVSDLPRRADHPPVAPVDEELFPPGIGMPMVTDEVWLRRAAETLTLLASRANEIAVTEISRQLLDQLETSLSILRGSFSDRSSGDNSE